MRFFIFPLIALWSLSGFSQNTVQQTTAPANPRDVGSHFGKAEDHRNLAMKYLQEAADQNLPNRLGEAQAELDLAAAEYLAYASVGSNESENWRITWAASGLLESYHAP